MEWAVYECATRFFYRVGYAWVCHSEDTTYWSDVGLMLTVLAQGRSLSLGLQYRIGVCTPAVYMYTWTINGGDLSAVDIVYGWKVEAMYFLGSDTINPI